ncbi:non-specific lipid-transfer protein 2-like [Miscanthus floridulus]|uniref:non-specific lipid-transfer protein 2-like n=1 Tax=Miscanthus floridulus TaxID=154761 RepID=UPI00345743F4
MARSVQLAMTIAVVAAVLLAAATTSEAAVTCGQVNSAIGPCLAYARGSGNSPSVACCSGVRSLNSAARNTANKRAACNCLKSVAGRVNGLNAGNVASIPYTISASINLFLQVPGDSRVEHAQQGAGDGAAVFRRTKGEVVRAVRRARDRDSPRFERRRRLSWIRSGRCRPRARRRCAETVTKMHAAARASGSVPTQRRKCAGDGGSLAR